jgi:hypothetical protein
MEQEGKYSYIDWNIRAAVKYTEETESGLRDDWTFFKKLLNKVAAENVERK